MTEAEREVVATRTYPTQTTTRGDGIETTYAYTYWPSTGFDRLATVTTTFAAVPTGENGSNVATTMVKYFDEAGRLRWTKDGEGYVNYFSYHPLFGQQTFTAIDVDPSTFDPAVSGQWLDDADFGASSNKPSRGPSTSDFPPAELVTTHELDNQGRLYKTTDSGGATHYVTHQNNSTVQFPY